MGTELALDVTTSIQSASAPTICPTFSVTHLRGNAGSYLIAASVSGETRQSIFHTAGNMELWERYF